MDLLNNLLFTATNTVGSMPALNPKFFPLPPLIQNAVPQNRGSYYAYDLNRVEEFCAFDDTDYIQDAIQKHWADVVRHISYTGPGNLPLYTDLTNPPYHIIYAYLVENTRIVQIFERLIFLYLHDEKLNKATTPQNRLAFQWIINTENLFFKYLPNTSFRNLTSQVRSQADATRRNAYFRLLGMDLAFGDQNNNPAVYHRAEFNNQPLVRLVEDLLREIWQAYTNARNQIGPNTTDLFNIIDTAQKIQELLMSRRTTESDFTNYRYFNLSREEYASVVMMSWLMEAVSYDSPLVQYLKCNGNTPGERLINVGIKVGLQAHSKSEGLMDIAPPMNTFLRRIELGDYNNEGIVRTIINSQANNLPVNDPNRIALMEILSIINNWEKATGHRIKSRDAAVAAPPRSLPSKSMTLLG